MVQICLVPSRLYTTGEEARGGGARQGVHIVPKGILQTDKYSLATLIFLFKHFANQKSLGKNETLLGVFGIRDI